MRRALVVAALVACSSSSTVKTPARDAHAREVTSNILRADYAGSPACEDCHHDVYAAWAASPMRNMTRDAKTATVRAPFDGASLSVGPDTATMTTEAGQRVMTHATPTGTTRFAITKIVGGRYREDFVGVDLDRPGSPERVLPATYVFATRSWRYKGYSVMVKERPAMSSRGAWSQECLPCHNTLPLATMLYDELYGPGLPAYQGKLSDRLLPTTTMWSARALDDAKLTEAIGAEVDFLGGQRPQAGGLRPMLAHAAATTNEQLDGPHLVELGIG
ncbi:MAG: hypothetical protein NT062_03605, partial [Proteobacteria bacterium]|nr:hypothetical protein [Pseudomonadota bacterium]